MFLIGLFLVFLPNIVDNGGIIGTITAIYDKLASGWRQISVCAGAVLIIIAAYITMFVLP